MSLKQEILDATLEEFNERGLRFTMDQLARRLGVSKKTLYQTFPDKETLFMEMLETCFQAIKASEEAIYRDETLDVVEKIRRIMVVLPERYKTIDFRQLYELEEKYPRIYKKVAHKLESDWDNTLALLQQAMAEGRIRPVNLVVLQIMVTTTIETFIRTNRLIADNVSYQVALEEMIEIIMQGIVLQEA